MASTAALQDTTETAAVTTTQAPHVLPSILVMPNDMSFSISASASSSMSSTPTADAMLQNERRQRELSELRLSFLQHHLEQIVQSAAPYDPIRSSADSKSSAADSSAEPIARILDAFHAEEKRLESLAMTQPLSASLLAQVGDTSRPSLSPQSSLASTVVSSGASSASALSPLQSPAHSPLPTTSEPSRAPPHILIPQSPHMLVPKPPSSAPAAMAITPTANTLSPDAQSPYTFAAAFTKAAAESSQEDDSDNAADTNTEDITELPEDDDHTSGLPLVLSVSKQPIRILYAKVQQQYTVTRRISKAMTVSEREKLVAVPVRIMLAQPLHDPQPGRASSATTGHGSTVSAESPISAPVSSSSSPSTSGAGAGFSPSSQLYVVARDICQLIHLRQGSVSKAIHSFNNTERARMPILCQRSSGTECTQVLTVLALSGITRLLTNSQSPLAPHVLRWITEQLEMVAAGNDLSKVAAPKKRKSQSSNKTPTSQSLPPMKSLSATPSDFSRVDMDDDTQQRLKRLRNYQSINRFTQPHSSPIPVASLPSANTLPIKTKLLQSPLATLGGNNFSFTSAIAPHTSQQMQQAAMLQSLQRTLSGSQTSTQAALFAANNMNSMLIPNTTNNNTLFSPQSLSSSNQLLFQQQLAASMGLPAAAFSGPFTSQQQQHILNTFAQQQRMHVAALAAASGNNNNPLMQSTSMGGLMSNDQSATSNVAGSQSPSTSPKTLQAATTNSMFSPGSISSTHLLSGGQSAFTRTSTTPNPVTPQQQLQVQMQLQAMQAQQQQAMLQSLSVQSMQNQNSMAMNLVSPINQQIPMQMSQQTGATSMQPFQQLFQQQQQQQLQSLNQNNVMFNGMPTFINSMTSGHQ